MAAVVQPKAGGSISQALSVFNALLPANVVEELVAGTSKRFYDRIYSPLVVVWCLIFQRLNADHACDAIVSHIGSGAIDHLSDRHRVRLSMRIRSVSTAACCRARQRLPLSVIEGVLAHFAEVADSYLPSHACWMGLRVALLDGTTFTLRPEKELVNEFGQASNQHGVPYWVTMRAVAAFGLTSGALMAVANAAYRVSEQILAKPVLAKLPAGTVIVGDRNFGVYSVAQSARHCGHLVLFRLKSDVAHAMIARRTMCPDEEVVVRWKPGKGAMSHTEMSQEPVEGRLLYKHLERDGFRAIDLYLFTTLMDASRYTLEELVILYGHRWNVELDLRYVKTTLDMNLLTGKSPDVVRKELAAGLAAYNLVRICMLLAAQASGGSPAKLSFAKCRRRVRDCLNSFPNPAAVRQNAEHLCMFIPIGRRLETCILQRRPRFRIEPRAVHRRPQAYSTLRGSRAYARRMILEEDEMATKS